MGMTFEQAMAECEALCNDESATIEDCQNCVDKKMENQDGQYVSPEMIEASADLTLQIMQMLQNNQKNQQTASIIAVCGEQPKWFEFGKKQSYQDCVSAEIMKQYQQQQALHYSTVNQTVGNKMGTGAAIAIGIGATVLVAGVGYLIYRAAKN
jgi:hypothetical protein